MTNEPMSSDSRTVKKHKPTSTVGRGRAVKQSIIPARSEYRDEFISVSLGDSLSFSEQWPAPTVIVSDGAYGVLGFEGDTSDHFDLPQWYELRICLLEVARSRLRILGFEHEVIGRLVIMVIASLCDRQSRHDADVDDMRSTENQPVRKPREHANVGLIVRKMLLTVLESSRYLSRKWKPCLDFETRRRSHRPFKNGIRKAGVLALPGAEFREYALVVEELDGIEFDQISEQRR